MKTLWGVFYLTGGGIAGTLARHSLSAVVSRLIGNHFPFGTLAVNALGCLAIGFLLALSETKAWLTPEGRLLWMAGFCGAFTTFSTWMLETHQLLKGGEGFRAAANIFWSLLVGYALFRIGLWIGESL